MTQFGYMTSLYLSKLVPSRIDKIIAANQDIYSSRNHFIMAAVMQRIRFEESISGKPHKERLLLRSIFLRTEVTDGKCQKREDAAQVGDFICA